MTKNNVYFKDKVVGYVEDNVFYANRTENQIFRVFDSVNFSIPIIERLKRDGINDVEISIQYKKYKMKYKISILEIEKCRQYDNYGDLQYVIPLSFLEELNAPPTIQEWIKKYEKKEVT